MGVFSELMKSVIFTIYILIILGSAIVTFYVLSARDLATWVAWAGAFGVIVALGAPYVLWPQRRNTDRSDRPD